MLVYIYNSLEQFKLSPKLRFECNSFLSQISNIRSYSLRLVFPTWTKIAAQESRSTYYLQVQLGALKPMRNKLLPKV